MLDQPTQSPGWTGQSLPRVEDAALLTGRGRYFDDAPTPPGTLHAAILRSPHAHATILGIDTTKAAALPGVAAILTGQALQSLTTRLVVGVKAPITCWPMAVDRVRYMGEAVAVVESVKTASDIYAPVSGQVLEINPNVVDQPALVNTDPHEAGWFFKIKLSTPAEVGALLTPEQYKKQIGG